MNRISFALTVTFLFIGALLSFILTLGFGGKGNWQAVQWWAKQQNDWYGDKMKENK
jgi:hypothetical protein